MKKKQTQPTFQYKIGDTVLRVIHYQETGVLSLRVSSNLHYLMGTHSQQIDIPAVDIPQFVSWLQYITQSGAPHAELPEHNGPLPLPGSKGRTGGCLARARAFLGLS